MSIKGSQLSDNSIGKSKLNLVSPTIGKDPVTREYLESQSFLPSTRTVNGKSLTSDIVITKTDIGLPLVDNTEDINKPVSTLQRTAINEKLAYTSIQNLRDNLDVTNLNTFYITDNKKAGLFIYDSTDTSSADDGALTLVKSGKVYKRDYTGGISPLFFGAVGDGVANDTTALTQAVAASVARKETLLIDKGYIYKLTSTINVNCDVQGFGTIKTQSGARFTFIKGSGTCKDITINGLNGSTPEGGGLFVTYAANIHIDNVKVKGVTTSAGMWCIGTPYIKITNCYVSNVRHLYGDGIYVATTNSPLIVNNTVEDFQRIGITTEQQTINPIIIGNTARNAVQSLTGQLNGGIWCENTYGATISLNKTENTLARGLVCTPASTAGATYTYTVTDNTVENADYGFAFPYSEDQILTLSGNKFIDTPQGVVIGNCKTALLSDNIWSLKNLTSETFGSLIKYEPTMDVNKMTTLVVDNCTNNIGDVAGISMPNVVGFRGDLFVRNCKGNFAFLKKFRTHVGVIDYFNCDLDFTISTATDNYLCANTGTIFDKCNIKLSPTYFITALGNYLTFKNSFVTSTADARIFLGAFGSGTITVDNSELNQAYFHDLRRAGTTVSLRNSKFDNYPAAGIFSNVVVAAAKVTVQNNTFSSTITTTPLQFGFGATDSIVDNNIFYSAGLISFFPKMQAQSMSRGSSANRPTVTQIGYRYLDTTIDKIIYWNGTKWSGEPSKITNASTTVPNKAGLNTAYGTTFTGSTIYYPSATGGAREFTKLNDSNTSDWVQTLWSDGVKTIIS